MKQRDYNGAVHMQNRVGKGIYIMGQWGKAYFNEWTQDH